MRERGSDANWFSVEFLIYYDRNQISAFAYVRRRDGGDKPEDEYDVRDGESESRLALTADTV